MATAVDTRAGNVALREGPIILSGGYGAPETFPGGHLADLAADILRHRAAEALQYGSEEGYLPLRRLIAEWLAAERVEATPEEIMIVTGAKQNIDLCARAFCPPGGTVLVSDPTYLNGLRILRTAGAGFVPIPGDEGGMDVGAVELFLARADRTGVAKPTLIYCIPDFSNPDSTVLSEERRQKLVDLAARYEIPILEDNPYRWLRFEGKPALPLKHFDRQGFVISTGTFAKVLAPGLRLAWVHARGGILHKLIRFKADGCTSPFAQMLAYEFYKEPGSLARHLAVMGKTLVGKRDILLESLAQHLGGQASWNRPGGGKYVWARFQDEVDTDRLASEAAKAGVMVLPGTLFFARSDPPRNYLRICFSLETEERIRKGVAVLTDVLGQQTSRPLAGYTTA